MGFVEGVEGVEGEVMEQAVADRLARDVHGHPRDARGASWQGDALVTYTADAGGLRLHFCSWFLLGTWHVATLLPLVETGV